MPDYVDQVTIADNIAVEGLATDYPAGTFIETHVHDAHQIVHASDGVSRIRCQDAVWILPPGRGLWVPAQTAHEVRCVSAVQMRTVYLSGERSEFPLDVSVVTVSPLMREIIVRFSEGASVTAASHLKAILIEEIRAAEVASLRLPTPNDPRIARLLEHFFAQPADAGSLKDWSRRLAMSRRSLIRLVRSQTGMSFRELRRQARVVAALERLALGHSVTSVAYDVGFQSPSAFIVAFKAVTGEPPGQYLRAGATNASPM